MARLDEIRGKIVQAPKPLAELPAQEAILIEEPDDDDLWLGPDEETFDDALDLMETSYQMLGQLLARLRMSPMTKRLIDNHRCDLKYFIDEWQVPDDWDTGDGK